MANAVIAKFNEVNTPVPQTVDPSPAPAPPPPDPTKAL